MCGEADARPEPCSLRDVFSSPHYYADTRRAFLDQIQRPNKTELSPFFGVLSSTR